MSNADTDNFMAVTINADASPTLLTEYLTDSLAGFLDSSLKEGTESETSERINSINRRFAASTIYKYAFDSRAKWPGNPIEIKGPYAKEFLAASDWIHETEKESWTQDFIDHDNKARKLNAYFIKNPKESHKYAVVAHGYRGNALQIGAWAKIYYDLGFNILAPDARAHGKSEGNQISFGWREKDDYRRWINKIVDADPVAQILVTGVSMGGATTMMSSGEPLPENVKAFVEDCGYSTVYDQFDFLKPQAKAALNKFYNKVHLSVSDDDMEDIFTRVDKELQSKQGFSLKEASSLVQLAKNTRPMLFIHGGNDNFVPIKMVHDNVAATAGPKEMWIVPNAAHGMSIVEDLPAYKQKVYEFLQTLISEL